MAESGVVLRQLIPLTPPPLQIKSGEIKMHPWFKDVDWSNLARSKAAFIPAVQNETDTSYFEAKKPVSAKVWRGGA